MKKSLAILLALCLVLALVPACFAEEAEYRLGLGIDVSLDSSAEGNAQVDATTAAVVTDKDGKIVAIRLDVAQSKLAIEDGEVDPETEFLTKYEKQDDYNMVKFSDATLEWYQQAANYEAYAIGKTADEIMSAETVLNEEGHTVFVDEELYASVSISIASFQTAVVKAINDEQGVSFTADEFSLGLGINTSASSSTNATDEEDGVAKIYSEFGAVVVDGEGVIIAALTDAIQPQISFDEDSEIVGTTFNGTKRELKEDYNMVKFSDATLEWYQQAANYTAYAVGKTADDLLSAETRVTEDGHTVFVDEDLYASVSISITGMANVLAKACNDAVVYAR